MDGSNHLREGDRERMIANRDGAASGRSSAATVGRIGASRPSSTADALDFGLEQTRRWLLEQQHADGYWNGELEGDTILESEYVLLMAYLGREREESCTKACKYLFDQQRRDGGWSIYPDGPFELSATVKAYFALKLVGMSTEHPSMVRAREMILDAGGAQRSNSFTRFYLALLGQIPYGDVPCVPPELVLVPSKWNFSLAAMSAWTRTIVVPLAIMSALKPVRTLPTELGIGELFRDDVPHTLWRRDKRVCWENFFLVVDRVLKGLDRVIPKSWRKPGLKAAERWMIDHFEDSDGLGAIFPPMIYTVVALRALGYPDDSPEMQWAMRHLDDLLIEEDDAIRIQPCVSPVWDTAIAAIAISDAGLPSFHPSLMASARWLLSKEIRRAGDWAIRRPGVEPSGWAFEFQNGHYPDIDDTAMVLMAIGRSAVADEPEAKAAVRRGIDWLLALQNKDGGWAAFDADIDNEVLTKVPFADHNAMLDPSCADITARILELLGNHGYRAEHPSVARALDYLWSTQEPEGCWYGRWGVNYIYGTWQVLLGLKSIGFPMDHPVPTRAADWLESVQQPCGGWGESCASYDDPSLKAIGEPTASQTAWAVLGLIAAGRAKSEAVRRGVESLLQTQNHDGTWDEPAYTGTGFPRVFYLKYHLYRVYFPLMALARYRAAVGHLPSATIGHGPIATRIPALPGRTDV
jgi:squalene-hopene/tetraprenyl-beta-curcumene cyclase